MAGGKNSTVWNRVGQIGDPHETVIVEFMWNKFLYGCGSGLGGGTCATYKRQISLVDQSVRRLCALLQSGANAGEKAGDQDSDNDNDNDDSRCVVSQSGSR
ncbi:unnamed protein product [Soboliphyme baturini]|uniref:Uncharacterized protein n=1 Tax=Soboliphyme baturini TaxID=241478 RepID=A0A183J3X0_9BILA|nr:unnamed protein product [Soboliphyme baturini]